MWAGAPRKSPEKVRKMVELVLMNARPPASKLARVTNTDWSWAMMNSIVPSPSRSAKWCELGTCNWELLRHERAACEHKNKSATTTNRIGDGRNSLFKNSSRMDLLLKEQTAREFYGATGNFLSWSVVGGTVGGTVGGVKREDPSEGGGGASCTETGSAASSAFG